MRELQDQVQKAKSIIEKGLANVQQSLVKLEEDQQMLQVEINQKLNTVNTSKKHYMFLIISFCFSLGSTRTIRLFNPFNPDIFLRSAETRKKIVESLSLSCVQLSKTYVFKI